MFLQPTILSIAGSDPSGGAGIQADLKTMTSIGVYGAAAITCLTVQNSNGVQEVVALSDTFVKAQIEAVLDDHNVTHIKIGMLGNAKIVKCIAQILQSFDGEVIYDPVLASTSGNSLLTTDAFLSLEEELLPRISYLTPNSSELQQISKKPSDRVQDSINCAKIVLKKYPLMKAIIVKGGHLDIESSTISDFLVQPGEVLHESKRNRIGNPNLHGTGCTYSSALASYLSLQNDIATAFKLTGKYMDTIICSGIGKSTVKNKSNGPLLHFLVKTDPLADIVH